MILKSARHILISCDILRKWILDGGNENIIVEAKSIGAGPAIIGWLQRFWNRRSWSFSLFRKSFGARGSCGSAWWTKIGIEAFVDCIRLGGKSTIETLKTFESIPSDFPWIWSIEFLLTLWKYRKSGISDPGERFWFTLRRLSMARVLNSGFLRIRFRGKFSWEKILHPQELGGKAAYRLESQSGIYASSSIDCWPSPAKLLSRCGSPNPARDALWVIKENVHLQLNCWRRASAIRYGMAQIGWGYIFYAAAKKRLDSKILKSYPRTRSNMICF